MENAAKSGKSDFPLDGTGIPTNESAIIASAVLNPGEEHPKRKL
jgi:hypothetical protein